MKIKNILLQQMQAATGFRMKMPSNLLLVVVVQRCMYGLGHQATLHAMVISFWMTSASHSWAIRNSAMKVGSFNNFDATKSRNEI